MSERQPLYDSRHNFRDLDGGVGSSSNESALLRTHTGRFQLVLDGAAMALSAALFIWAFANSWKGQGVDWGVFSMPPFFLAGMTGLYSGFSPQMSVWHAVHVGLCICATSGVVFNYGAGVGWEGLHVLKWWAPMAGFWLLGSVMGLVAAFRQSQLISQNDLSSLNDNRHFASSAYAQGFHYYFFGPSGKVLFVLSSAFAVASAVFYGWATYNSLADPKHVDVGMLTFAISGVASVSGMFAAAARPNGKLALLAAFSIAVGTLIVAMGYGAGLYLAPVSKAQKLRWAVAMGVWIVAGIVLVLVSLWHRRRLRVLAQDSY